MDVDYFSPDLDQVCDRFEEAWRAGSIPNIADYLANVPFEQHRQLSPELVSIDMEYRWSGGVGVGGTSNKNDSTPPGRRVECWRVEDYLAQHPILGPVEKVSEELIVDEYLARRRGGQEPDLAEYGQRFPNHGESLRERLLAAKRDLDGGRDSLAGIGNHGPAASSFPPVNPMAADRIPATKASHAVKEESSDCADHDVAVPEQISRYRVIRRLGAGGFGQVYLGHDENLQRQVAIKVPHARHTADEHVARQFLDEARMAARLDHSGIVPIYDFGRTNDGSCFIVSKYIEGQNLAVRLREAAVPISDAVELMASLAEALQHAHQQGLTHRDIKPSNILIDADGRPYLTDFGVALPDESLGRGPRLAGTPAYMSPEQARGEAHRIDGRSDIFSLGVVLYELLAGRRPFRGETARELLHQIATAEARPPRQYRSSIPKPLERICLKALARRAADRYSAAIDLADELRQFLRQWPLHGPLSTVSTPDSPAETSPVASDTPPTFTRGTASRLAAARRQRWPSTWRTSRTFSLN